MTNDFWSYWWLSTNGFFAYSVKSIRHLITVNAFNEDWNKKSHKQFGSILSFVVLLVTYLQKNVSLLFYIPWNLYSATAFLIFSLCHGIVLMDILSNVPCFLFYSWIYDYWRDLAKVTPTSICSWSKYILQPWQPVVWFQLFMPMPFPGQARKPGHM